MKPSITVTPRTMKDKTKYSINFVVSYKGSTKHLAVGIVVLRSEWEKIMDPFNLEKEYVEIRQTLQLRLARCIKLAEEVLPFNIETFLKVWELKKVTYIYAVNEGEGMSVATNGIGLPKGVSINVSNKAILANDVPDILKCYDEVIKQTSYLPNKQWHITSKKILERYLEAREDELGHKDTLSFGEVQPDFLYEFEHWMLSVGRLNGESYSDSSYCNTMKSLRRIFVVATEDFGVPDALYPFTHKRKNKKKYYIKKPGKKYRIMKDQAFQDFLDSIVEKGTFTELAKHFFMILAEANGTSPIDALEWRNKDYENGMIFYQRRKTINSLNEPIVVPIQVSKLLADLIEKYRNKNRSPNARLLGFLPDGLDENRFLVLANSFKAKVNYHLAIICEVIEIDRITLYFARNLWANTQRKLGTDLIKIKNGLGHNNLNTTYQYLNDLESFDEKGEDGSGIIGAVKKKAEAAKKKPEPVKKKPASSRKKPTHLRVVKRPSGGKAA
jgi:integrase